MISIKSLVNSLFIITMTSAMAQVNIADNADFNETKPSGIQIELIRKLGVKEKGSLFYRPSDLVFGPDGCRYILDESRCRVVQFSSEGEKISHFGAKGKKKGELLVPLSMDMTSDGNLLICDAGSKAFKLFSPDGDYLENWKFKVNPGEYRLSPQNEVIMYGDAFSDILSVGGSKSKRHRKNSLLSATPRKGKARHIGTAIDFADPMATEAGNRISWCLDKDGTVYVTYHTQNRIEKYDARGNLVLRIRRPVKVEEKRPRVIKLGEHNFKISVSQISCAITVDTQGRIWVATFNRKERDNEQLFMRYIHQDGVLKLTSIERDKSVNETDRVDLDVFSSQGVLLARLPLNQFVDDMRIEGDRLFILDKYRQRTWFEYKIL